jgi:methyl-accepting chemotaxis protein
MTVIARLKRLSFGRPGLARRLALGFGALVAMMIIVVGVAGWQALQMQRQLDGIVNTQVPKLIKVDALVRLIADLNVAARDAIVFTDDAAVAEAIGRIEKGRSRAGQQIQDLQDALSRADPRGQQVATELGDQSSGILVALVKFTRVVKAHNTDMARTLLGSAVQPKIEALAAVVDKAQALQMATLDEARQASAQASRIALLEIAGALAVAVLLAAGLAWRISASVTRPVNAAVQLAERIAAGDLCTSFDVDRDDEIGRLQQALAMMQTRLAELVRDIRDVAGQMAIASDEIASGSSDLSLRTEQTASSLQATASSMGLLTERVRRSADSAHDANALASSTTKAAQRGGNVVSQVVANMSDISSASRRIVDITSVIDGISFQTNILALNAAVEAARAGEHGRGFAVVAEEVRNLARRAASASREIKSLIDSSVEKVDSGSRLVQTAGGTMKEIVDGVQRVTQIIADISTASAEQSSDLDTVNDTVNRLDEMTQQNSALVEESTAAAQSMREQSQRLQTMVNAFQV